MTSHNSMGRNDHYVALVAGAVSARLLRDL